MPTSNARRFARYNKILPFFVASELCRYSDLCYDENTAMAEFIEDNRTAIRRIERKCMMIFECELTGDNIQDGVFEFFRVTYKKVFQFVPEAANEN